MELNKVLESRRSIRQYSKKNVSWHILSDILESATYSPSSGNQQNWRFIIIANEDKKKEIAVASLKQLWIQQAPVIVVVCADFSSIKKYYSSSYRELSLQNCAIASNNIMLRAASLGLGSCYVAIFDKNAISRILRLPDDIEPMMILTLGYSDETPEKKHIISLNNLTYFEEYGNKKRTSSIFPLRK